MTLTTDPALAADRLASGGLVAFPTETVYGLGAHAEIPGAVSRIYAVKGRPREHPVIVHIPTADLLSRYAAVVTDDARRLADACWPGPLTMILPRTGNVPDAVTGGRDTVGLRVPDHPLALRMLEHLDAGVAAPSANPFGRTSPTEARHVVADLGDAVDLVLDGGPCRVGLESTIVDLTGPTPTVLRLGGLDTDVIADILGREVADATGGPSRAPGMMASHYAPVARLRIATVDELQAALAGAPAGTAVLGLPPLDLPDGVVRLEPGVHTPAGYAHDLYALLRAADAQQVEHIVAVPPSGGGIAAVVRDRLSRAAADSTA